MTPLAIVPPTAAPIEPPEPRIGRRTLALAALEFWAAELAARHRWEGIYDPLERAAILAMDGLEMEADSRATFEDAELAFTLAARAIEHCVIPPDDRPRKEVHAHMRVNLGHPSQRQRVPKAEGRVAA